LLTASNVIAMELVKIPIVALKATRIRFTTIPIILVLTILACLVMKLYLNLIIIKSFEKVL